MEIKHFSEEDIRAFKEKYPEGQPKEWALIDTVVPDGVMGFYDTEEQAKAARDDWNVTTMVEEAFRVWASKTAEEIGIDIPRLCEFVKATV